MSQDYYEILGVSKSANSAEIKQAYKRLARIYHPDNKDTGDEQMFKTITEAYSVIADSEKRSIYDRVGHRAFTSGPQSQSSFSTSTTDIFSDLQDIFDSLFTEAGFGGGRRRQGGQERGRDIHSTLELEFSEAAFGAEKTIDFTRSIVCDSCLGSGADPSTPPVQCSTCGGRGEVRRSTQSFLGMITQVTVCPTCRGAGQVVTKICERCNGDGFIQQRQELIVEVPAGAEHGSRLLWPGRGSHGRNAGPPGDLYVSLSVKEHGRLVRDDLDMHEELDVTIWQAILGAQLTIETIHGEQSVELRPGTQPDAVITLKGQGIRASDGRKGSHHIHVKVKIPQARDLPRDLVEKIADTYPDLKRGGGGSFLKNIFGGGGK